MWIEGRVTKPLMGEKYWGAVSEALSVYTQGRNHKDAMFMIKDAVELLVDAYGLSLVVEVRPGPGETVYIGSSDVKAYFAFLLRRQRQIGGTTAEQAAKRMGSKWKNAYAVYEQGKREPAIGMMEKLLKAANHKAASTLAVHFGEPKCVVKSHRSKKAA